MLVAYRSSFSCKTVLCAHWRLLTELKNQCNRCIFFSKRQTYLTIIDVATQFPTQISSESTEVWRAPRMFQRRLHRTVLATSTTWSRVWSKTGVSLESGHHRPSSATVACSNACLSVSVKMVAILRTNCDGWKHDCLVSNDVCLTVSVSSGRSRDRLKW